MGNLKLDTVDDVSRATTPNTLCAASDADLDHIFNVARGHLRKEDPADIRQTESSLAAVLTEKSWRKDKWSRRRAWIAMVLSIPAIVLGVLNYFSSARSTGASSPQVPIPQQQVTPKTTPTVRLPDPQNQ